MVQYRNDACWQIESITRFIWEWEGRRPLGITYHLPICRAWIKHYTAQWALWRRRRPAGMEYSSRNPSHKFCDSYFSDQSSLSVCLLTIGDIDSDWTHPERSASGQVLRWTDSSWGCCWCLCLGTHSDYSDKQFTLILTTVTLNISLTAAADVGL